VKKNLRWLALPAMLCSMSLVQAEGVYLGLKAGEVDVDLRTFDNATNVGLVLGYEFFSQPNYTLSIEGEYTDTVSDGEACDVEGLVGCGDWDIQTIAVYGVGRITLSQNTYLKLKAGLQHEEVEVGGFDDGHNYLTFGAGLGYNINNKLSVEVEYTMIEEDASFISAGVNYKL